MAKVSRRDDCKSINYGNSNSKIITVKECGSLLKFLEKIYERVDSNYRDDMFWSECGTYFITLNIMRYCSRFDKEEFNKHFKKVFISPSYKRSLEDMLSGVGPYKIRGFSNPFFFSQNSSAIAQSVQLNLENFDNSSELKNTIRNTIPELDLETDIENQLVYFDPSKVEEMNLSKDFLFKYRRCINR
ncbi:hypothetical protein CONCODRAFT_78655 [Conidiobolus coronatus NRRL 28638]|uniref:Uncharacterized protein n=1 Tax=Conidiobolus coronatus (strain ATCC 28846 / CBS 209.66 / NRRL 28638) TaxID=796925 RepID=A0A137P710_CONC2|nr:hypothetical protein CONCODRAFT_78655 [Conidiobolus coronatus NRRL 28638]|eukprot:KXN70796.1 hypothetical protein CONCODRAFT_78655 [Conidiobolus coronatus NRRL 28638]